MTLSMPLVSIICRSINRPELNQALESIAGQEYPSIEVVLVDALGKGSSIVPDLRQKLNLVEVSTGSQQDRSAAANLGLDNASGEFILFLDDDDFIAPAHISSLMEHFSKNQSAGVVYSSVRKVNKLGEELEEVFARDYDPVLLRRDNYIPIHAVLFSRLLLGDGCRFDESLTVFEDWDFWLQMSQFVDFTHVNKITAFYREGGDSKTTHFNSLNSDKNHPLKLARTAVLNKWVKRWTGEQLDEAFNQTERINYQKERRISSLYSELLQTKTDGENLEKSLLEQMSQLKDALFSESNEVLRVKANISELNNRLASSYKHAENLREHAESLQLTVDLIYSSKLWRLMGPIRRVLRFIKGQLNRTLVKESREHGDQERKQKDELVKDRAPSETSAFVNGNEGSKSYYREVAATRLDEFLGSSDRMVFCSETTPRVSILLVLYNQAPLTFLCLQSVKRTVPDCYELVIVDNNSDDQTGLLLERLDGVKIIKNDTNTGFVKAVNQGVNECSGRALLLLNNDAILHERAVDFALNRLDSSDDIGAVGGKILLLDGSLQEAGSQIFSDGSCAGYGRGDDPNKPEYQFCRDVDYCSGAFLLTSRELFVEMGKFDLDFAPAYYEESDFCLRLAKRNYRVVYEPKSVLTHYEFASSGGYDRAAQLQIAHKKIIQEKHSDLLIQKLKESALESRSVSRGEKILFIDDRVPHAGLGSGYPRCKEIIMLLADGGFDITFYPLTRPTEDWEDVYATLPTNIEVMLDRGIDGLENFLFERMGYYDTIIISRDHNMRFFLRATVARQELIKGIRIIYDAEAVVAPRRVLRRELLGEEVTEVEKKKLLKNEVSLATGADRVITVSEKEASYYQSYGFEATTVLGHSLNPQPTPRDFSDRKDILFVGALRDDESPNVDSLLWFCSDIFPVLLQRNKDLRLVVVGDSSAPSLDTVKHKNIDFLGRVEDLSDIYNQARIFVAPTRFAAGIPHKIHEAASRGVPTVATGLLTAQLGWSHEEELLSADNAEDFVCQCDRLLNEKDLWSSLRTTAFAAVKRDCSPEDFKRKLFSVVNP